MERFRVAALQKINSVLHRQSETNTPVQTLIYRAAKSGHAQKLEV